MSRFCDNVVGLTCDMVGGEDEALWSDGRDMGIEKEGRWDRPLARGRGREGPASAEMVILPRG